jgi:DNA primase catalytic core
VEFSRNSGESLVSKRLLKLHAELAIFWENCLKNANHPGAVEAREYMKSRELTGDVVESFGIGFALDIPGILEKFAKEHGFTPEEMHQAGVLLMPDEQSQTGKPYDRFRGRLMFPICDTQGRPVAFSGRILDASKSKAKYVNSPETPIFTKSKILYGLDKAQRNITAHRQREAIICEGQIDVIRCHAKGFGRAVASQGTAFTDSHASLLARYADSVVLLFDQDNAGQKAAVRTAQILLAERLTVRIAKLPLGEDPDSYLRTHSQQEFQAILDAAMDVVEFNIEYLMGMENAPSSDGAISRVAEGVLETIACCENPIHSARMLQKASELLRLPVSSLEAELERVQEKKQAQAEALERRAAYRTNQERDTYRPVIKQTDNYHVPLDVYYPEEVMPVEGQKYIAPTQIKQPAQPAMMCPEYFDVCALLVHNAEPGAQFIGELMTYLPLDAIDDTRCSRILDAFYRTELEKHDFVVELQNNDAELAVLLGNMASMPNKVRSNVEHFTVMDVAHELILAVWRRWCTKRLASPKLGSKERFDLILNKKKMLSWESGKNVIRMFLAMPPLPDEVEKVPPVPVEPLPPPEIPPEDIYYPPLYEADPSSYSRDFQERFPSEEYPEEFYYDIPPEDL